MLNINEQITCPVINEVGNFHFEMRCEDCDVNRLARKTLGAVEDLFQQGRATRNQLNAYQWAWALLSPTGSNPHWAHQPYVTDPDVRRIVRKLLTIRGFAVPVELSDEQPTELIRSTGNDLAAPTLPAATAA